MTEDDVLFGYRLQLFDLAARMTVSTAGRVRSPPRTALDYVVPGLGTSHRGIVRPADGSRSSWGGDHLSYLDAIADPVLASELPTALWCARG